MEFLVCSFRDEVSGNFQSLTLEISEATAIRNFKYAFQVAKERRDGLLYSDPSDFALYKLGDFDSTSGCVSPCVPQLLCRGERLD